MASAVTGVGGGGIRAGDLPGGIGIGSAGTPVSKEGAPGPFGADGVGSPREKTSGVEM